MRQIVLDTETTGLDPKEGHRLIEIAGVELINRRLTGKHFHYYINPERDIDAGAFQVHGISTAFLADKPLFGKIADEFLAFIHHAELIIHNAKFDVGFLDHELTRFNQQLGVIADYCKITDTLVLARERHPGQRNSLDALCKRYEIDNSKRDLHGALLDAQLLAQVYLIMTGGQGTLFAENPQSTNETQIIVQSIETTSVPIQVIYATAEELEAHQQRLAEIKQKSKKCLWLEEKDKA